MKFSLRVLVLSMLVAVLFSGSFRSEAKTGLDVNHGGFGPTIKGIQIGTSYDIIELVSEIENLVGKGSNRTIQITEHGDSISIKNENGREWIAIARSDRISRFRDWIMTKEFIIVDTVRVGVKITDLEKFLSELHENKQSDSTFSLTFETERLCEIKAEWEGQFVAMAEDGTRTGDIHNIYRIFSMEFSRPVFGASNMPVREFAQELINSYNLPSMEWDNNGWKTSDSDNYKNGWGVRIFHEQGVISWLAPSIKIFNTNVRGNTSFN